MRRSDGRIGPLVHSTIWGVQMSLLAQKLQADLAAVGMAISDWPGVPYGCSGTVDAKVVDAPMAKAMSFAARWGSACGRAFDAGQYLNDHPQFDWMANILKSRPSQPWTQFKAGE